MRKKMMWLILFLTLHAAIGLLYSVQPRFRSENGHLYIESSTNRNITIVIKGQGYINVNNENLLQVLGQAKEAWDVVESFRTNDLPAFTDTIKNILPMIDGPKSLTSRVTALEMQMVNSTAVSTLPAKGKGGNIPATGKLRVRINNLEKRVTNLVNLLSISECSSNPCQNGGTCTDLYNGFQCNCPQNWQGRLCELDVDECVRFLHTDLGCQNGAECKNTPGSYECLCAPNWYGLHCTKKKNDCNLATSSELCGNGVCVNQMSAIGYACICNQGWTIDDRVSSPACTKDVDECKENRHTCSVNPPVECRNTRGSFTCGNCPDGYVGDGFLCTDVNECLINNGGCSINPRVMCINTRGSFMCGSCPPGYSGDGFNCLYVDGGACAINNGGCHQNAECKVYAETTIQCTCRQGFIGNGIVCVKDSSATNVCANNPCGRYGSCISNRNNTFSCECNEGYIGNTCDIHIEDPCFINPCRNGDCIPEMESNKYSCSCHPGYFGILCDSEKEICGGYFKTPNGIIQYPEPNTTLKYNNNLDCAWIIEVAWTSVINISFDWIDLENSTTCNFDYVSILNSDSEDGNILGKFCGNILPVNNSIISDSNEVIVRFRSDGSKNGRGFQLKYNATDPICGGVINVNSHGTLSSPGSPGKYPKNRDCYWTLNTMPGKRIQFNFFLVQFENHVNCSYDYLEIRDGFTQQGPILATLCNSVVPPPILTSGSHANLHFHSDNSNQDYGFQMSFNIIEGIPGCGGIYTNPSGIISSPVDLTSDNYDSLDNLNCEWHIRMPLKQKLKLVFVKKFGIKFSKNCATEFLEIYDGTNIQSPLIGRYCGSVRFDQPIITTSNEVTVLFKADFSSISEGFSIKYETLCGGIYTDNKGIIESPFYPNPYPQNKICTYLIEQPIGKAIQLSFLDMDIEDQSHPNCIYDSLEIRDGDNEKSPVIALLCGQIEKLSTLSYISTHNYMWLKFTTDSSNSNKGFRANYSTIDIGCGGILKNSSGIIQSSRHQEYYLHDQMCKWIISVNESNRIQLIWSTFSLENHPSCQNDYVEIYDDSILGNASKIARYCGTKVPPILTSLGNRLTIIFKTDHSIELDGFMLSYVSLNKAQACGGNFFTVEGFIESPKFPDKYPSHKDCTWVINLPVTNQIELNISQFELETSTACRFDFLEIRNGGYSTSPLIGKFCGTMILPIISSIGNSLFIRFVSDGSRERKGFSMQWYGVIKGCGGLLNSGTGHISSPNYPLPVRETLECFYKIVVAQGNQIQLTILDIELIVGNNPVNACIEDFIEFYDGENSASKSLGTFCSVVHSSTIIQSSSNKIYIKFRNSGFQRGRGFSLKYFTDCNITLKGHQGAIELTTKANVKTDQCSWTIMAPQGNKINITFTSFFMHVRMNVFSPRIDSKWNSHFLPGSMLNPLVGRSALGFERQLNNYRCSDTKFNIFEGRNINEINTELWKYCSSDPPLLISSTKDIVRISYVYPQSNLYLNKRNSFRLEWIVDGCGGTLNKFSGEFTSPRYPQYYPSSTTCEWNIVSEYGYSIEITIEDLSIETSSSCTKDFLAIYSGNDDSGPELLRVCHRQTNPITITPGGNQAFVRFVTDYQFENKGFKATYEIVLTSCGGKFTAPQGTIHSNNYPQHYDSNSTCTWYIEIAKTHLIKLTFVDFNTRSNLPGTNSDKVLVYDGGFEGKVLLNHSGNSIPPPIISLSNKLLVFFEVGEREIRAKGFKANYTTACGAKLITNDSGIISSDPYVSSILHENCTWTIISDIPQSKIYLSFTHIDIVNSVNDSYNMITNQTTGVSIPPRYHKTIRILDGRDLDAPEIINLCNSDQIPPIIVSNGPAMIIEFTGNSIGLDSFSAVYSVRSIACGGTYDIIRGTISTPNYPNNYLRDSECVWILKSSVGNRISLNFIDFQLEEDEFCNEDYVEVRENDSIGTILGIFCGLNLPTNITTSSTLWVKFRSNSIGSAKGFTADFKYVTKNYLTQKSGEISSPTYPRTYRGSEDYFWTINVDVGKRIQIFLKDFMCLSSFHHLKIFDGDGIDGLILLERNNLNYNNALNEAITSSYNVIFIHLIASSRDQGGINFVLSWTQVDGLYLKTYYPEFDQNLYTSSFDYYLSKSTNESVNITSPGYPYGYSSNLNITWTIHTDSYNHIEVEFIEVDLCPVHLNSFRNFGDYIMVETIDPSTTARIELKKIYRYNIEKKDRVIIGKNKVILTFVSDSSLNGTGFKAIAKINCGGELTGTTGVIDSSNLFYSHYYSNLFCTWNVTVRPGRTILVKLITMQFSLNQCSVSYVLLKNGFYEDSPVLGRGRYCNDTTVTELSTTENKLQIQIKIKIIEAMQIVFEEKSINCGGEIHLDNLYNNTEITSPSYPNIPQAHIECIWRIVAPTGERMSISIEDIDLLADIECKQEYLEFRDGAARFSPLIIRICENTNTLDIESTNNFLYIKYFTDINVPSNGFKLNVTIAKCGGTRKSPQGSIISPNYPGSYEQNMDCEYRIIAARGRRVELKFETVNLKRRIAKSEFGQVVMNNETYDDTLTVFDVNPLNNNRTKITTIFGSNLPLDTFISTGRELVIKFKSQTRNGQFYGKDVQAKFAMYYWTSENGCSKNYEAESGEITSPKFNSHTNYLLCTYLITVPRGRRVTAEIVRGSSIIQTCDDYRQSKFLSRELLLSFITDTRYVFQNAMCIDPVFNPSTSRYVYESSSNIMVLNYAFPRGKQNGFLIKFSSAKPSICGDGIIDASIKGKIEIPTGNVTQFCTWDFTNTNGTLIIVADFNIITTKLTCNNDDILFATDGDENFLLMKYCSASIKNDKLYIISSFPTTKITVKSDPRLVNFTATFDYFINSCGGQLYGQKITITSPNYPHNYRQNNICAWLANLPENENIIIRFNDIDLESSCDNNYVVLYDGPNFESPVLGKYCGNTLPESLTTTSSTIWIVFYSDIKNSTKNGFNLTIESAPGSCGNVFVSETGVFSTKNYPSLYPNNEECEWTIAVGPGYHISLKFIERFSLEQSINCTKDYIQVFDNINDNWVQIGDRLCGRQIPPVFNSKETKLKVRIRTDSDIQGDGFKASWSSICGEIFTQNSGRIISPNYPGPYKQNLYCNYTIVSPNKKIKLLFKFFHLEAGGKCGYDNLTIYENADYVYNPNMNSRSFFNSIVGIYCGYYTPKTLTLNNGVYIIFQTDGYANYRGFEIHYKIEDCGGEITTPGLIKSSIGSDELANGYPSNQNCTWIIRAPPGQRVQLVFSKFRLEGNRDMPSSSIQAGNNSINPEDICPYDAVFIFDETSINSSTPKYLGVYCGVLENSLPEVKSETNVMYIQLITDSSKTDEGFVGEVSFIYDESKGCGGTIRLNYSNSNYTLKSLKMPIKSNLDCGWLILVEPSYVVQVQVVNYVETPKCPLNTTNCRCSSIQFFDGPGRTAQIIRQLCPENNNNPPLVSSTSEAFLRYQIFDIDLDVHFEINITSKISVCGQRELSLTNETQILTSPNYPLPYRNDLICTWSLKLDPSMPIVTISFIDLDLENTKDCSSNYLEIRYMPMKDMTKYLRMCHQDHKFDFMQYMWSNTVDLKLHTDSQKTSKGFKLEYSSSNCRKTYNKENGRVIMNSNQKKSPVVCTFTISLNHPNLTISVYFSKINVLNQKDNNFLKIYDGPSVFSPLINADIPMKYSGPFSIFSTGPSLTMSFKMSPDFIGMFDMIYTSTKEGRGCGGKIYNTEGLVTSPLYPYVYRKNATCKWDIAVPRPHSINILFRSFDLGTRKSCDTDYLEIYDVNQMTEQSSLVTKYCGQDVPAYHTSQSGAVSIRYVTSTHSTGSGWTMRFHSERHDARTGDNYFQYNIEYGDEINS
ncbi:EGF-like, conserved site,EGF-like calcium-binding domain,CUB domain,EGF domain,EGF-like calcium- [Cinara cedri]|uniref:Cubilin n=1 Tax=Cinara cedri TaxID=506608 RepID=A0A5E4NA27_9HEMI|nr:EGF-like, conserved site,EGF-like calcium-binding domain,CUB domain,EGF domain,EGF-like calcium- [Cinara cedri]